MYEKYKYWRLFKRPLSQGGLQSVSGLGTSFPGTSSARTAIRVWKFHIPIQHLKGTLYSIQVVFRMSKGIILTHDIISWCHDEVFICTDHSVHYLTQMETYTSSEWKLEDGTSFSATSYKPNNKLKFPTSKIIDIEYILANTAYPTTGSVFDIWFNIKFGSFWIAMEMPAEYRNLTAAANVILGHPEAKDIARRMVTLKHLVIRNGLEDCSWPENLKFDPALNLGRSLSRGRSLTSLLCPPSYFFQRLSVCKIPCSF